MNWSDTRPGDAQRPAVTRKAAIVSAVLVAVMLATAIVLWWLLRTLSQREAATRRQALHDALTSLPNRAGLFSDVSDVIERNQGPVALVFVDLDGFKDVNDTYDHETGDRLIKSIASGIKDICADEGTAYRLGGDEFVALFAGEAAHELARKFSNNVMALVATPFNFDGRLASVGASIGIAVSNTLDITAQELLRRADVAMYEAKAKGKGQYCFYETGMDIERQNTAQIAFELKDYLARGEIGVAYQPIVNAHTRQIVGVEALARWPKSSSRQVPTDVFIKVAESHGLVDQLGSAMLTRACEDAQKWPDLRIAVNVSPVQLRNAAFVTRLINTVKLTGLDPKRLELEVTEGTLLTDVEKARAIFSELRAQGIRMTLDDFGAGYSSIPYLRDLQFDRIKIDRSLVSKVLDGQAEAHVVQGAILMANGFTKLVTAEGIEREEQASLLRLCGSDEMQGFLFSKPVSAAEITELLARENSVMDEALRA